MLVGLFVPGYLFEKLHKVLVGLGAFLKIFDPK